MDVEPIGHRSLFLLPFLMRFAFAPPWVHSFLFSGKLSHCFESGQLENRHELSRGVGGVITGQALLHSLDVVVDMGFQFIYTSTGLRGLSPYEMGEGCGKARC